MIAVKLTRGLQLFLVVSWFNTVQAQVFKVTREGLVLVADSVSNKKITTTVFTNYKGPQEREIHWHDDWMTTNAGKYVRPTVEYDSLIVAKTSGGWGCISKKGKILLDFKFRDPIYLFKKGRYYGVHGCTTNSDGQQGCAFTVSDWTGKVIVEYGRMVGSSGDAFLMRASDSDKYGIVSSELETLLPFEFKCTSWDDKNFDFSGNGFLALRNKDEKCGVVNNKGATIIPFDYNYIDDVVFDVNTIEKDKRKGLLDAKMKWIVPAEYEEIKNTYSRRLVSAYLLKAGKWSILDSDFHVHKETFDSYDDRGCANLIVKQNGKYGVYNVTTRTYSMPLKYDSIRSYPIDGEYKECAGNNHLLATKGSQCIFYDSQLHKLFETDGAKIEVANCSDYFVIEKAQKMYLMRDNGKQLAGPYEGMRCALPVRESSSVFYPYFFVINGGKYGLIDKAGKLIVPMEYDAVCEPRFKYSSDGNHGFTFVMLKANTIYYFDKNGVSAGTEQCEKCDNFCKQ